MAFSRVIYEFAGGDPVFTIPFPYAVASDVKVQVGDDLTTDFSWVTTQSVRLDEVPPAGTFVTIYRETSSTQRAVDYINASILTADLLNTDSNQLFFLLQEAFDLAGLGLPLDVDGNFDAGGQRLKNVGAPVNASDGATKAYIDALMEAGGIGGVSEADVDATAALYATMDYLDTLFADNASKSYVDNAIANAGNYVGFPSVGEARHMQLVMMDEGETVTLDANPKRLRGQDGLTMYDAGTFGLCYTRTDKGQVEPDTEGVYEIEAILDISCDSPAGQLIEMVVDSAFHGQTCERSRSFAKLNDNGIYTLYSKCFLSMSTLAGTQDETLIGTLLTSSVTCTVNIHRYSLNVSKRFKATSSSDLTYDITHPVM